jgi:phosphoribosyl-ATP pyrophosphohydrolase
MSERFTLADLVGIIDQRAGATADRSYTRSLLDAGPERAAKKFGEEAIEAVVAAVAGDKRAVTLEAADVVYHLLVLLKASGVSFDDVLAELGRRTTRSGVEEKASRPTGSGRSADG